MLTYLRHLAPYPRQFDVVRNMYPGAIKPDYERSSTSRLGLEMSLTGLTDTVAGARQLVGVNAGQRVPFL